MDKFGRRGRSLTFKPNYLGKNIGTARNEQVDPAAQFVAGMLAHKDATTLLMRTAIGGGANNEDLIGGVYGIFGDSKFNTPALRIINESAVVVAAGPVKLSKTSIFDGLTPVTWAAPVIYNQTTAAWVTNANTALILADADTDLARGEIGLNNGVGGLTTGDIVLVSYYYRPLNEDLAPLGLNETATMGAVTIWKDMGFYEVSVYEPVDDAGLDGLPAVNQPLYCSPNGLLTAFPPDPASEVIAICRRAPTFAAPFMLIETRI